MKTTANGWVIMFLAYSVIGLSWLFFFSPEGGTTSRAKGLQHNLGFEEEVAVAPASQSLIAQITGKVVASGDISDWKVGLTNAKGEWVALRHGEVEVLFLPLDEEGAFLLDGVVRGSYRLRVGPEEEMLRGLYAGELEVAVAGNRENDFLVEAP